MQKSLTIQQQRVYDFLKAEIRKKGYPPTIREICLALSLSSTATIHSHLKTLDKKGYIRRNTAKNRSIEILEPGFYQNSSEYIDVPILGNVRAGSPLLAVENIEGTFPIHVDYAGNYEVFMLRVVGDSMKNVGIYNRDLILVRQQSDALNGQIVVALIEDAVTVKTYFKEKDCIILQPENESYEPMRFKEVMILGRVIGLYRDFIG